MGEPLRSDNEDGQPGQESGQVDDGRDEEVLDYVEDDGDGADSAHRFREEQLSRL